MSEALASAGPIGYLVLVGALVGLIVCAVAGAYAMRRRRVSLSLLMLVPMILLGIGSLASWSALKVAHETAASAEPTMIPVVAITSAWAALAVDWLARWGAALVLCAAAWAAAVGSFLAPGQDPRRTPIAAAAAAAVAIVGAIGVGAYSMAFNDAVGGSALVVVALLLVGGLGVAMAAFRRAADDDMNRVAAMRFVSSICYFFSILHAARAVDLGARMNLFAEGSAIVTASDLAKAIQTYAYLTDPVITVGVLSVGTALLVAVIGFFGEIGEVVDRYTMFDMFGVVALFAAVCGVRAFEDSAFRSVATLARNGPAVEMFEEMRNELPSAAVTRGDVSTSVRLVEGGFGDVIVYDLEEWTRLWRWNGRRWVEDHDKLAEAELADRPPLVIASKSLDATKLLDIFEHVDEFYLELRGSEVKLGSHIPPELARLQVTFLPLRKSATRDLKTELWTEAASAEANFGPTFWYGEKDDSLDPVEYANAVLTGTQAQGLHLLVSKRKVSDVVTTCLPYLLDAAGEADENGLVPLVFNQERWCALTGDELEVVRTEADGSWELPQPANVNMAVAFEGGIIPPPSEQRLRRELGALGYCAERAVEAGEILDGRMTLHLSVNQDGQVYATNVDEKSKLQSPAILRCAAKRFRRVQLTMPEVPELPEGATPPPPAPLKPGEEPPPPPKATVHLDFVKVS
jgi:hypothetical protein